MGPFYDVTLFQLFHSNKKQDSPLDLSYRTFNYTKLHKNQLQTRENIGPLTAKFHKEMHATPAPGIHSFANTCYLRKRIKKTNQPKESYQNSIQTKPHFYFE